MFGPGVENAIEQYSSPDRELLAVLQLFRAAQKVIFKFRIEKGKKVSEIENTLPSGKKVIQEIFNDTVIGYGQQGGEIVRITVEEPTFERPKIHVNSI
jgi:nitrate reductase beta subunit